MVVQEVLNGPVWYFYKMAAMTSAVSFRVIIDDLSVHHEFVAIVPVNLDIVSVQTSWTLVH